MKVQFDIKCTVNLDLDSCYYEEYRNRINEMSGDELKEELLDDYLKCCECTAYHELDRLGFFNNVRTDSINIVK